MKLRVSRIRQFTACAIVALAMLSAFAGARPALAGVATGESAFHKGDFPTAAREFQGPARGGDPLAQYYLGVIYGDGLGDAGSLEEGLAWLMCVGKGAGLPPAMKQDAIRRRARLLSGIAPFAMEQAELRAAAICNRTVTARPQAFTTDADDFEDVRPARGLFGTLFFFPGDTVVFGATVAFHDMGLLVLRNVLAGMVNLMGDLIFGLLSLIGWLLSGKFVYFLFVKPLWKAIVAAKPSSADGPMGGAARDSVSD